MLVIMECDKVYHMTFLEHDFECVHTRREGYLITNHTIQTKYCLRWSRTGSTCLVPNIAVFKSFEKF